MRQKGEQITTLGALMDAMTIEWNSRKTSAQIHYYPPNLCKVEEYFDTGRGHSGAIYSNMANIDLAVFEEAKKIGYITGKLEPGRVSTTEFVLTDNPSLMSQAETLAIQWREKYYYQARSARDVASGKPGTYIKIVKIPEGEAPEEIRKAWVGLILPCHPVVGRSQEREKGVLSNENNGHNRYGYAVSQKEALEALACKDEKAASWWNDHGFPKEDKESDHFIFSELEAQGFAGDFEYRRIVVHYPEYGEYDH